MPAICSISCTRFRRAFPGGYFDAVGAVHYTHTDYQGSIIAVTDSTGKVVQKVDYYPYGEPWREPTGQPMLFSGKERTSLADYHFDPRSLMSAALLWDAPDQLAGQFRQISPYSYCAGNPILYTDPTGKRIYLDKNLDLEQIFTILLNLQNLTDDHIVFSTQKDGSRMVKIDRLGKGNKVTGTKLIRALNSDKHKISIANNGTSTWSTTASEEHLYDGIGEDVTINFGFERVSLPTLSANGIIDEDTKTEVCFAHELIHSLHFVSGNRAKGSVTETLSQKYASVEDLETIGLSGNNEITENSIRREQGLKPRASYNYLKNTKK